MFRNSATNLACIVGKCAKYNLPAGLGPISCTNNYQQPVRYIAKHYDPKFKKERKAKVFGPHRNANKEEERKNRLSKLRDELKVLGKFPVKYRNERPIFLFSSLNIVEPYEPPKGDGKFTDVLTKVPKTTVDNVKTKGKTLSALRKIKSADSSFTKEDFLELAKDIYIKAHTALADQPDDLIQYVTEFAYPKITTNTASKTIRWKFIESLEPAKIVQARHVPVTDNVAFGQITVRFNTQQSLAVYDRFGRLMQGSEILKKDVLEYIVFEKNLVLMNSSWRLHAKLFPPEADMNHFACEKTSIKPDLSSLSDLESKLSPEEKAVYDVLSK